MGRSKPTPNQIFQAINFFLTRIHHVRFYDNGIPRFYVSHHTTSPNIRRSNPFLVERKFIQWNVIHCKLYGILKYDRTEKNICNSEKLSQWRCHLIALKFVIFQRTIRHIINGHFFRSAHRILFWLGLPTAVKNCTYSNQTQISVEIHCIAGFDGGLSQYFVLELVSAQTNRVK